MSLLCESMEAAKRQCQYKAMVPYFCSRPGFGSSSLPYQNHSGSHRMMGTRPPPRPPLYCAPSYELPVLPTALVTHTHTHTHTRVHTRTHTHTQYTLIYTHTYTHRSTA